MKNMPKLSRRGFLKRAPVAAVAAPVAAKEVAEQRILAQASAATMGGGFGVGHAGFPLSSANEKQRDQAYNLIRKWDLESLRMGIIPEYRRPEVESRIRALSRIIDPDIAALKAVPFTTMHRMQRARAEKIVVREMLREMEGSSVWDSAFRKALNLVTGEVADDDRG